MNAVSLVASISPRRSSSPGSETVLGHLVPIVEPSECGHTAPLENAGAWIRILREGAPKSGSRLIGRVYRGGQYDPRRRKPAPGIDVKLEGANGTITTVADDDGIYDFTSVPSGAYTLHATVIEPDGRSFSETQPVKLKEGEVRNLNVYNSTP